VVELKPSARFEPGGRPLLVSLSLAVLGFIVLGFGWATARPQVLSAYLTAFASVAATALGALIFLMIGYVVRASWSVVLRRLNEAIASVFPLLAVLFVPIALGLSDLYPWVNPSGFSRHDLLLLLHKSAYLNRPFFILRSVVYLAFWTFAALWLIRASLRRDSAPPRPERATNEQEDEDEDEVHGVERRFSAALLPLVALTLTFASFDWLMSLQPLWLSTLFGVYYFAGGFVASLGLLAALAYVAQRAPGGSSVIRPAHFHALGRLMLGFTVFWAYCAFFQALLIQIADKPSEVGFYVQRLGPGWRVVSALLAVVRFVVPFALLLPRGIKFRPRAMALVGLLLVAGEYLDVLWLVSPTRQQPHAVIDLWQVAAVVAVTASCVAYSVWRLRGQSWTPVQDPKLAASIAYRSPL